MILKVSTKQRFVAGRGYSLARRSCIFTQVFPASIYPHFGRTDRTWRVMDPVYFGNYCSYCSGYKKFFLWLVLSSFVLKMWPLWMKGQDLQLDPADCMPISRPRFAWCSDEVHQMDGVTCGQKGSTCGLPSSWLPVDKVPDIYEGDRRRPPPYPAGLDRATKEMTDMWQNDAFRYPPYQYHLRFWIQQGQSKTRLLDSSERELLLGFGAGHTDPCQSASLKKRSLQEHEGIRCSLCGDSLAILPFQWLEQFFVRRWFHGWVRTWSCKVGFSTWSDSASQHTCTND